MRSYLLAGNAGALRRRDRRARGTRPARHPGLRQRARRAPGDRAVLHAATAQPTVDAVVSLTGFSLVGGPAYNDAKAAEEMLAQLDVPYLAAHPVEFQTLEQWGALRPRPAAGREHHDGGDPRARRRHRPDGLRRPLRRARAAPAPAASGAAPSRLATRPRHAVCAERAEMLAARVAQAGRAAPQRSAPSARSRSCCSTSRPTPATPAPPPTCRCSSRCTTRCTAMQRRRLHASTCPASVDALRDAHLDGNAARYGADANVHAPHPGRRPCAPRDAGCARSRRSGARHRAGSRATARSIFVLGAQFGNVFVGVQPAFGYEGDPMRLLFEKGFAPTHAFSRLLPLAARGLRRPCGAALRHPRRARIHARQAGRPVRRLLARPADRRPAELLSLRRRTTRPKARSPSAAPAATLISYLTPPVAQAGLYRGLVDLKASIERWRGAGRRTPSASAPSWPS